MLFLNLIQFNYNLNQILVDESLLPKNNEESANKSNKKDENFKKSADDHKLEDDADDYIEEEEIEAVPPLNEANLRSDL